MDRELLDVLGLPVGDQLGHLGSDLEGLDLEPHRAAARLLIARALVTHASLLGRALVRAGEQRLWAVPVRLWARLLRR
jgi:hypothetical protein